MQNQTKRDFNLFDSFSKNYESELNRGISISGESKEYFSLNRVLTTKKNLHHINQSPKKILDFGCGIGTSCKPLLDTFNAESVVGIDLSSESILLANEYFGNSKITFNLVKDYIPANDKDLVFCSGVFHHIEPEKRTEALSYIRSCMRSGGLLSFWENNPWNPGTRWVMSRIPFDKDAVTLNIFEARTLLKSNGFEILNFNYSFIFPRFLRALRFLEPTFSKFPFGAQYQILAVKI